MELTRTRSSFPIEWIAAVLLLFGTLVVGLLIVRELRIAPPGKPGRAAAPATWTVPADAVSVPTLMLGQGNELAVGDQAQSIAAKLSGVIALTTTKEEGLLGPREIRGYNVGGTRFIVIVEPFERGGAPRVAAIYLR